MQPEVIMTEDEKEAEKILAGGADFEFKLNYEVIPAIEIKDFSDIKVTRPVYDVPDSEIDEQVKRIAESSRSYEAKAGKAVGKDSEQGKATLVSLWGVDGARAEAARLAGQAAASLEPYGPAADELRALPFWLLDRAS